MSKRRNLQANMEENHLVNQTKNNEIASLLGKFRMNALSSMIETSGKYKQGKKKRDLVKEAIKVLTRRFSSLDELILYLQLKYIHLSDIERKWNVLELKNARELMKPALLPETISQLIYKQYKENGVICRVFSQKEGHCMWTAVSFDVVSHKRPLYILTHIKLSLVLVNSARPMKHKSILDKVIQKAYKASAVEYLPDIKARTEYVQRLNIKIYKTLRESITNSDEYKIWDLYEKKFSQKNVKKEKKGYKNDVPDEENEEAGDSRLAESKETKTDTTKRAKHVNARILEKKEITEVEKNVENRKDGEVKSNKVSEKECIKSGTSENKEITKIKWKVENKKDGDMRTNKAPEKQAGGIKASTSEKEKFLKSRTSWKEGNGQREEDIQNRNDKEINTKTIPDKKGEEIKYNIITEKENIIVKAKTSEKEKFKETRANVLNNVKETKHKNITQDKVMTDKSEDGIQRHVEKRQMNMIDYGRSNKRKKQQHDQAVFDNDNLPTVTNLSYRVKSKSATGSKENMKSVCVVEFHGMSILKGLEKLVETGVADKSEPSYLHKEPRSGKADFVITL